MGVTVGNSKPKRRPEPGTRAPAAAVDAFTLLLRLVDGVAAILLAADLCVVLLSVFYRYVLGGADRMVR